MVIFDKLKDIEGIKDVDIANMKRLSMELTMTINVYLFLLLLRNMFDDEEDKEYLNLLINQGTRVKTDLLLYINPNELRNMSRDIIPAFSVIKDASEFIDASGKALLGNNIIESGVHKGDNRLINSSAKMIPLGRPIYSTYNNLSQDFVTNYV